MGRHKRARTYTAEGSSAAEGSGQEPRDPDDATKALFDSLLVAYLVYNWAIGIFSAVKVQQIAYKSWKDQKEILTKVGASNDHVQGSLERMAKLGSWGKYPGNINAELKKALPPCYYAIPTKFEISMLAQKTKRDRPSKIFKAPFYIFLPHILFSHLFTEHKQRWSALFLGGKTVEQLKGFWAEVRRRCDPRLSGHPMCGRRNWMSWCIPLAVHSDGVPVTKVGKHGTHSMNIWNMQSLFARGTTMAVKMFLFAVFSASIAYQSVDGVDTMEEIFIIFNWSMHYMYLGVWPRYRWDGKAWPVGSPEAIMAGKPSAGGFWCVLWSIKGDLDDWAKNFRLDVQ